MNEEWRGGGSGLVSDLDLEPDMDTGKILWIQIRIQQNDADPLDLDPDPQHYRLSRILHFAYRDTV